MRLTTLVALALFVSFTVRPTLAADAAPPNIVYILADDLGYAELGCFGQKKILTPNLDRMAAEGMKFTQNYCGAPVCAPSRCVLMTGKHLGHAYIRDNQEAQPEGQEPIPASEVTIASLLKDRGYATAAIGKWGLGPVKSSGDPIIHGFDLFFGYNCQRQAHSYYPDYLYRNDERVPLDNSKNDKPATTGHGRLAAGTDPKNPASYTKFIGTDYAPDHLLAEAIKFIGDNKSKPFFLYYPSPMPHTALQVPEADVKAYAGKWDEPDAGNLAYVPNLTPRATYAAMITRLDSQVGALMAELKRLGLDENTLVIFSSDNGTTHIKDADPKFFESVGPLRGLKGSVYEGGIRVPMIARWPGHVAPGTTSDLPCAFYDVMPTLCEVAGVKPPADTDGISFLPTLLHYAGAQTRHEFLLWEFYGYGGQQAVRLGDFKGVRQHCHKDPNSPLELYNLATDIHEEHNIAAEHPDIVKRIEEIMKREHAPSKLWKWQPSKDE